MSDRPKVAFVAWTPAPWRARDIARELGGEARIFYAFGISRRSAIPLRYAIDAVRTAWYLLRRRPRAVIATHPPLFAALIAYAYCAATRSPFVLDSHIASFGLAGDGLSRVLLPVHARLAPRAAASLVTGEELAAIVRGWGATPLVVHEPPMSWRIAPPEPLRSRPRVLFAAILADDEPLEEVLAAARAVPEIDLHVTGDPSRCPPGLLTSAPSNVTFVGFLRGDAYRAALEEADIVLSLSTERVSVMRTAYEAVYSCRPLIVADHEHLRSLFPQAVHVPITTEGIAQGLRSAVTRHAELVTAAPAARAAQEERWSEQRSALEQALGMGSGG